MVKSKNYFITKCNMVLVQNTKRVKYDLYQRIRNFEHSADVA